MQGIVLSTLWPFGKSLRLLEKGKGVLLPPIVIWSAAGRIKIIKAVANILSAEKKIVKKDERARRRRETKIKK
jgi:hypothetical protein